MVQASLIIYEKRGIEAIKDMLQKTGRDYSDSGFLSILKVIANLSLIANNKKLVEETNTARRLLESLGHQPEIMLKKGERLDSFI